MAFDKIDPKVDFPALERDVLAFWERTKAFEKLCQINRGKPKWSFLDGPITANNPMGVHHAWGRSYKDIYQRYHAAAQWDSRKGWGHELRYQNGFDCQGLWVEVEVEKEHGFEDKKQIETFGIDKFVEECKARASKFADLQTQQSKRLGYWMDWENSYYTMSDENNYGIWAFLKKCHERKLIYRGKDVMPWCARCGTGLSQMEMNEGYREVGHTSVFVTFPIVDQPSHALLVWTTTPWTLSSNVAAAVKTDMTYVKVKQGDRFYYVGKANLENARKQPIESPAKSKAPSLMSIQSMFKNNGAFKVVEELKGEALVGLKYTGPFDYLDGAKEAVDAHRVIAWDMVTESEGTGVVHIAPGCGAEDYALSKELGLPQIAPLHEDGCFRSEFGFLAGKRFNHVSNEVVADLKERKILFAKERYVHRYPHCWRCKEELAYRLVDEWFINMDTKLREEIVASTKQARWIPAWGMERELDWLRNMGDWMISKKRYWGLALPIWECIACGHFDVIGSRKELKEASESGWDAFDGHSPHRPWIDGVKIRCKECGDKNMTRIKDVGNPWLDASIVPFSTMGYLSQEKSHREDWKKWFPADFIVEALPGQFRNWFYALLTVSTVMEGRAPFKVVKGHGLVTDDDGKPMHKSEGNAIWFEDAAEQFGVDVMRWLYAATSPERNVHFGPAHCDEVRREIILPWWNVYAFFCNLARVDDFRLDEHRTDKSTTILDDWILFELDHVVSVAHEAYSQFDVARLCTEASRFINVLSTWYVRRSRRRFYGTGWPADKRAAYSTLYTVLKTFNRVIAPIVPFLSESIYQNLVVAQSENEPASVHHHKFPVASAGGMNPLRQEVSACIHLVSMARSIRKDARLKIRQPLAELMVFSEDEDERKAVENDELNGHILEELNVKKVTLRDNREGLFTATFTPNMKTLGPKFGRDLGAAKDAIADIKGGPLEQLLVSGKPIRSPVEGTDAVITEEDVIVTRTYVDGWAGTCDGTTVVLIDKRLTPELKNEGIARDVVRNVQNLRKQAGLEIADRVRLALLTNSDGIRAAIRQCSEYICSETLAIEIGDEPLGADATRSEVDVEGETLAIELTKAS